LLMYFFS